jgi:hypothetical protein
MDCGAPRRVEDTIMRFRLVPAYLFATVALGSGCGSDDSGGSAASVPLAEVPAKFAEAACAALDDCYGTEAKWLLGGEDCVTNVSDQHDDSLQTIESGIDSGKVKYSGDKIEACLAEVRAQGCDFGIAIESEVCRAAIDGTVELGGDCQNDLECVGESYCKSGAACPGVCTAREAVGANCEEDGQCATGLACAVDTKRCYEPSGAGDLCGGSEGKACGPGLFCVGQDEQSGQAGNCRVLGELLTAASGASCDIQAGPFCASGVSCSIQSFDGTNAVMECVAEVASGAACKIAFPDMCPDGEFCDVPEGVLDGTCKVMPAAGQACAIAPFDTEPSLCAPYTRCEAGTCKARQPSGASCQIDAVCLSESCVAGKCAADGACG